MASLRLEVDIDKVKETGISDAEKQIKEYLLRIPPVWQPFLK